METQEITRDKWQPFLDRFSKEHQGYVASIQVIEDETGVQMAAESLPFVGISAEDQGSEKGSIIIMLGTEANDHIEHMVNDVGHLWQKTAGATSGDALEIEATDGAKTILQLQPIPLLP